MSQIRYYIPEDGDNENHPNVFLLPSSTKPSSTGESSGSGMSPKLGDIRSAFPVPGNYHFRFKCPLVPGTDREKNTISVWMDCYNDNSRVGVWKNTIFAKVTRIHDNDATGASYATGYTSNGSTTRSMGVTHSPSPIVNNSSVTQSTLSAPSSRPPQINNQVPSSETLIDVPSTTSTTTTTHNPSQHSYPATTITDRRPHPVAVEAETLIDVYADEPQQPVRSITLPTPNNTTSQPHSSERSRSRSTPLPLQQTPNSNNNVTINNMTHANDTEEGIEVGFNTSEGNLLDVDNHHPNPHVTTSISSNSSLLDMNAAPTSSSGLLDMNAAPYSSTSTPSLAASGSSSAHDDFLGMCASPTATATSTATSTATATATSNTPAATTVSTAKAVFATPPVVVKSQPLINTNVFSKPGGRNGGDDFGGLNW